MPVKYILDTRERQLQRLFSNASVPHETKQLDLGDILILYSKESIPDQDITSTEPVLSSSAKTLLGDKDTKNEKTQSEPIHTIIIERKSYTDLKSSMADGRYHEQKSRYLQLPRGTVYYILECNDSKFESLDYKQYLGMYVHTMIRDGIGIFHTSSMEDTFAFICKIGKTLDEFGFNHRDAAPTLDSAGTQIKKKKAEGIDVYINQICCISGLSNVKARAISVIYPNMKSLIYALETGTFKVKSIGEKLIENLKNGLFPVCSSNNNSKIAFTDSAEN